MQGQAPQQNQGSALAKYGQDLVQAAQDGKLDPVIGRDDEIRRVVRILSRRRKNNPVLVGGVKSLRTNLTFRPWCRKNSNRRGYCPENCQR